MCIYYSFACNRNFRLLPSRYKIKLCVNNVGNVVESAVRSSYYRDQCVIVIKRVFASESCVSEGARKRRSGRDIG